MTMKRRLVLNVHKHSDMRDKKLKKFMKHCLIKPDYLLNLFESAQQKN